MHLLLCRLFFMPFCVMNYLWNFSNYLRAVLYTGQSSGLKSSIAVRNAMILCNSPFYIFWSMCNLWRFYFSNDLIYAISYFFWGIFLSILRSMSKIRVSSYDRGFVYSRRWDYNKRSLSMIGSTRKTRSNANTPFFPRSFCAFYYVSAARDVIFISSVWVN